jgi:phosphate transport system permease protein
MAVTFVIGNQDSLPTSLMSATTTVTATIANEFTEASSHLYLSSMYLLALILFLLSFLLIIGSKMFFLRKTGN